MSIISFNEWLSIFGTTGTILLVLMAYWNKFKPFKPSLNIFYGTTGEYLSTLKNCNSGNFSNFNNKTCLLYRLKIENENKFRSITAKNVYIKFNEIRKMVNDDESIKLQPFNPFKMRWTSGTDSKEAFTSNLGRGEYLYINFFSIIITPDKSGNPVKNIMEIIPGHPAITNLSLPQGFPRTELFGDGKFKFKISVFGDNIKSKQYEFKVECSLDSTGLTTNVVVEKL